MGSTPSILPVAPPHIRADPYGGASVVPAARIRTYAEVARPRGSEVDGSEAPAGGEGRDDGSCQYDVAALLGHPAGRARTARHDDRPRPYDGRAALGPARARMDRPSQSSMATQNVFPLLPLQLLQKFTVMNLCVGYISSLNSMIFIRIKVTVRKSTGKQSENTVYAHCTGPPLI